MGQRHQIYLKLPGKNYGKDNPNTRGPIVVGIHHQWLFGKTACEALLRMLNFAQIIRDKVTNDSLCNTDYLFGQKDKKGYYSSPEQALGALASLYSVDATTGYYHAVHKFRTEEASNHGAYYKIESQTTPFDGDNNDGVTLLDFTGKEIKYCFMNIGHIEGSHFTDARAPRGKPISAEKYLQLYYKYQDAPKDLNEKEWFASCARTIRELFKFKVMTKADARRMFPECDDFAIAYKKGA